MPILHHVKLICDRCGKETECYARVTHDDEPSHCLMRGREPLAARNVGHVYELPDGWEIHHSIWGSEVVCPEHDDDYDSHALRDS